MTLEQVIRAHVLPGSIIKTDEWRGYTHLVNMGMNYQHQTVNHSVNFVDQHNPDTHTQNIEASWSKIKRDMRRRIGRMCVTDFQYHLMEYVWRSRYSQSTIRMLFSWIFVKPTERFSRFKTCLVAFRRWTRPTGDTTKKTHWGVYLMGGVETIPTVFPKM